MSRLDDIKRTIDDMVAGALAAPDRTNYRSLATSGLVHLREAIELCVVACGGWRAVNPSEAMDWNDDELITDGRGAWDPSGDFLEEESTVDSIYRRVTWQGKPLGERVCWLVELQPDVNYNGTADATTGAIRLRGYR